MDSLAWPQASSTSGTPLHTLSPERANRQALPQSPSVSGLVGRFNDDPFGSTSRNSDVIEKVMQFNRLNTDLTPKHRNQEAALQRAVVGREEAESETRRLREENLAFRKKIEESNSQVESGKARELKVAQRLETLMEDMQRIKESEGHKKMVYEKEVRRARKEAFKSSSALVNMQEELKTARNRYTLMREEVEVQKRKVEHEGKRFLVAQLQQVSLEEEIDELKQKVKLTEAERDALRTSLKEEEVARIAAEGRIPLPPSTPDAEFASPKKSHMKPRRIINKDNEDPFDADPKKEEIEILQKELELEKKWRDDANELIDAMKLECQLKICSCRRAEVLNKPYIFVESLGYDEVCTLPSGEQSPFSTRYTTPAETLGEIMPDESYVRDDKARLSNKRHTTSVQTPKEANPKDIIEFSPKSGTFRRISLVAMPLAPSPTPISPTPSVQEYTPAPPANLVPPPVPIELSKSPSTLSIGQESRPSDDCMILVDGKNPTPQACQRPPPSPIESLATPHHARTCAVAEFPPTPGADLTLTAPININIPASIARQFSRPTPEPVDVTSTEPVKAPVRSNIENDAITEPIRHAPCTPAAHSHSIHAPLTEPRVGLTAARAEQASDSQLSNSSSRLVEMTTTTTIPLANEDSSSTKKFPYSPGASKTREEALESIQRWRAGRQRARSAMGHVGGTPRKILGGSAGERRDVTR